MKVGRLPIIGVLLNAVKTSWFCTTQGHTYLTKRRLLLHTHYKDIVQNSYGGKIAAEHGVIKAKGSWVTVRGHSCQQKAIEYSSGSVTIPTRRRVRALSFGPTNYEQCLHLSE